MSDERPKPQYGEYAPEGWVAPQVQPIPTEAAVPAAPPPRARRSWDVILTFALLAIGLYTVVAGYGSFPNLPALFDQVFAQLGVGDFTSDDAARAVGFAGNVVQTALWLVAAVLSSRSLRANRIAFWWPLGAGMIAGIIVVTMIVIVIASDPAYSAYLLQQQL